MEGTNCNGEGGWTRVAFVNMSEPGATCPVGLTQIEQSGLTLCSRNDSNLIQSTIFATLRLNYSAVCGRLQSYQDGAPEGFSQEFTTSAIDIDNLYVDGVSITLDTSPRQHIWTYAVGQDDEGITRRDCPCNRGSNVTDVPSFVGDNYYCESGTNSAVEGTLYINDTLWDGMQCNNLESTCCTNSRMPWFHTTLPETTNDDIELRLMFSGFRRQEESPLNLIELYIR